tara:strand:- start:460 stop:1443 length:984 start_codon:yes stop_codon:yes gene_type:complete
MSELKIIHDSWELNKVFTISRSSKKTAETVEVQITKNGKTGFGEGVPYSHYDESIESVTSQIEELRINIENDEINLNNLDDYISAGSARNAIDCALWDIECKTKDQDIWSLLDISKPSSLPCSYTIVLDTVENMLSDAIEHKNFPIIKIKVNNENLEQILTGIRSKLRQAKIIIDANEGFTLDTLKENMSIFEKTKVDLIEQPLSPELDNQLLNFASPIPICADESFHTISDFEEVSKKYSAINIKLDKTGGLSEALLIANKAKKNGKIIMLGCMVATSLSILPALSLYKYADFIDLDGPCFLKQDRENGIKYENGTIRLNKKMCWG